MSVNGKRDGFGLEDLRECARTASMKRGRADSIVEEVRAAVLRWPEHAAAAGVAPDWEQHIASAMRLDLGA